MKRARGTGAVDGYFLASRSLPWWAVGLSDDIGLEPALHVAGATGRQSLLMSA